MALFEQISQDIVAAMKAKDKVKLEALRNVKKLFLEAKTAPGANDTLTDDAAIKIMAKWSNKVRTQPIFSTDKAAPTWLRKNWHRSAS